MCCIHLYHHGTAQLPYCDIGPGESNGCSREEIRRVFQELVSSRREKNRLGIAGGPPHCMFSEAPEVELHECPCFEPVESDKERKQE